MQLTPPVTYQGNILIPPHNPNKDTRQNLYRRLQNLETLDYRQIDDPHGDCIMSKKP